MRAEAKAPAVIPGEDGLPGARRRPAARGGQGRPQPLRPGRGPRALPAGDWRLVTTLTGPALEEQALGWLLDGYRFDRYKTAPPPAARLVAPAGVDAARLEIIAAGEALTRDLINTPAADLGPAELEAAVRAVAGDFGADWSAVTEGEALLAANLPLIHAVGRASPRAPRLIEMHWGERGRRR